MTLARPPVRRDIRAMVTRANILILGVTAGVVGCLLGGLMLGLGMNLIVGGQPLGWLLLMPAAPAGGVPGWLLARQLARQLE